MAQSTIDVISFQYEPFDIDYEHDGIIKSYTPDFLVFRANRCELVEVKPNRFLSLSYIASGIVVLSHETYCGVGFVHFLSSFRFSFSITSVTMEAASTVARRQSLPLI